MDVKIFIGNKSLNTMGAYYESGFLRRMTIKCNEEEYKEITNALKQGIEIGIEAEGKKYLMGTVAAYHYLANELDIYPKELSNFA